MSADILQLLAVGAVLAVVTLLSMRLNRPEARAADRAREVVREAGGASSQTKTAEGEEDERAPLHVRAGSLMARLGDRLPLFNAKQRREVRNMLLTAGFRQSHALSVFITVKLVAGAGGGIAGVLAMRLLSEDISPLVPAMLVLGGLQLGLMLPEILLRRRVAARRALIHRSLPDALDLMVICTNAGYSLGASIKRLGIELAEICPPLAHEFEITAHEIQMNADPVEGLRHLAERTGVESLRSLVATLIQAHQYGTPITQSLKTLARTERTTRILTLEEKGAKLAAKLTMPMMLLILPAVMLIAGGPAFLSLMEAFK